MGPFSRCSAHNREKVVTFVTLRRYPRLKLGYGCNKRVPEFVTLSSLTGMVGVDTSCFHLLPMEEIVGETGNKLLTLQEVADYLGVSVYTVRRRVRAKKLQAFKVGGQYRVSRYALDLMLQEGSSVDLPSEINNLDLV